MSQQSQGRKVEEIADGVTLYLGDCREILPTLEPVDLVLADPPYGTTQCSWDAVIPFDEMWTALGHVTAKGVPVLLFGAEPFSSLLRVSNLGRFKFDWLWDKPKGTGFLNAPKQPLRCHELISVFCEGQAAYYPQKTKGHIRKQTFRGKHLQTEVYGHMAGDYYYDSTERYPRSVITFSSDTQNSSLHETQKPVDLTEYLIRSHSSEGQTVLDFTMGSGTTGVAAVRSGRRFRGVEKDQKYFDIARSRIAEAIKQLDLFVEKPSPRRETWDEMWARPFEPEKAD